MNRKQDIAPLEHVAFNNLTLVLFTGVWVRLLSNAVSLWMHN